MNESIMKQYQQFLNEYDGSDVTKVNRAEEFFERCNGYFSRKYA